MLHEKSTANVCMEAEMSKLNGIVIAVREVDLLRITNKQRNPRVSSLVFEYKEYFSSPPKAPISCHGKSESGVPIGPSAQRPRTSL